MLFRWDTIVENINLFIEKVKEVAKEILPKKIETRGRPPKRKILSYILLLVGKEFERKSLRGAEARLSELICKERIDHSVISYWENKPRITEYVKQIVSKVGMLLEKNLDYSFSMIDSTKFSSWNKNETEFHVLNRICKDTVYPVNISFLKGSVVAPVSEVAEKGEGDLLADAWYDNEETIEVLFKRNYIPIICPNKNRWRGYYRKKARKIYRNIKNRLAYRQRGRGESPFGSLTNYFGDRIKSINDSAMKTRIASRVLCYQVRLLMRLINYFTLNY